MKKAETQHDHAQRQSAQRQGGGAALESPQAERIAQLEAMAERSPQAGRLAQLAAIANNSPQAATQRKTASMIRSGPRMAVVQREEVEAPNEMSAGGALDVENSAEHEGNEGGPGDDDRIQDGAGGAHLVQRVLGGTLQRARGYVRGAATAASKAITETLSGWAMGGLRGFAPVPRDADQEHVVNHTTYKFHNDGNGFLDFQAPLVGPAVNPVCEIDIRPWFGPHGKAIKNAIETTRYNHFLAANEARAAGLVGYPNNVLHGDDDYDRGYDGNGDGGSSPAGLTWHHHADNGRMQLIDRDVHAAFRHRGGYSTWGGG